ncbi:hypothetical protein [Leptospira alexanderi]|uniref:hypothetical protein n=1 Tax=Leptospira alexanderi TaxID=100053 RepID=UPI0014817DB1|nr:hypothetical protein [Leptospira alexanderi]
MKYKKRNFIVLKRILGGGFLIASKKSIHEYSKGPEGQFIDIAMCVERRKTA